MQKSVGGLEIKLPNGKWLSAPVVDDAVLVNIGDLFEWVECIARSCHCLT